MHHVQLALFAERPLRAFQIHQQERKVALLLYFIITDTYQDKISLTIKPDP